MAAQLYAPQVNRAVSVHSEHDDDDEVFHPVDYTQHTQHTTPLTARTSQPYTSQTQHASSPATAAQSPPVTDSTSSDERCCRICLLDDNQSDLISPCKCKGSMRYVHASCLDQWRQTSTNQKSFYQCDQCLYKYNFKSRFFLSSVLSNKITLHVITVLLFIVVAICSGFVLKLIDLLSGGTAISTIEHLKLEAQFELMTPAEQRQFIRQHANTDFNAPHNWTMAEFFTLDITHFLYGFFGMGVTGFLTLLLSVASGTGIWLNYFRIGGFRSSNNKNDIHAIVIILVLVVGLGKCMVGLYGFVESQAQRVLKDAKFMVQNVS